MQKNLTKKGIRIALPKGRMSDETITYLHQKGLIETTELPQNRKLIFKDPKNSLEFLLVRSKDVGTYVEQGACDLGIIGFDLLTEHDFDVYIPMTLPYGECELCIAYPVGRGDWKAKKNVKIATKYSRLTSRYFFEKGFNAQIIELYGSIEIAPLTGIADAIVDLVSTGKTLQENNLTRGETILKSSARLIVNRASYAFKQDEIRTILDALK